ncbi:MAG: hypothetical protein ACD_79C00683G0001 [uncultured bacterium]|nr:MAG: hypothetical protein ACD_79C00683G0001 [uncultured bacterium]
MARECVKCGKKPVVGRSFSLKGIAKKKGGIGLHCTGISKRKFNPNLQKIKIKINNGAKRALVCTSCIQKGLIEKA